MSYVLTFISDPAHITLTEEMITSHFPDAEPICLSEGEAYDIQLDAPINLAELRDKLPDIDLVMQPLLNRKKKLLVADMDSTIVTGETLDDLAEFAGIKDKVAAITQRAMNGEIGFEGALYERVAMLKGLSEEFMNDAMKMVTLTPGALELVNTMRVNGAFCALISGGFTFFTAKVAAMVGFDLHAGNTLEIIDGELSGKVLPPILNKDSKLDFLKKFSAEQNITTELAVSVGDGANDLPMLLEAGLGIAFHAKPNVVAQAKHAIHHTGLTSLLFAQGYKRSEFVTQ